MSFGLFAARIAAISGGLSGLATNTCGRPEWVGIVTRRSRVYIFGVTELDPPTGSASIPTLRFAGGAKWVRTVAEGPHTDPCRAPWRPLVQPPGGTRLKHVKRLELHSGQLVAQQQHDGLQVGAAVSWGGGLRSKHE